MINNHKKRIRNLAFIKKNQDFIKERQLRPEDLRVEPCKRP